MGIGFYFPTFASPTTQWVPSKPPHKPILKSTDYPEQITGETAGGSFYVQDKGVKRETFELHFERLTQADLDSALTFYDTVKKAFSTFEYRDADGTNHQVRWTSGFDFSKVVNERHSGTVQLRKEPA